MTRPISTEPDALILDREALDQIATIHEENNQTITVSTESPKGHGLSLFGAAVFIVGEMAGSGILALPAAVAGMSWFGLVVIVLCCLMSGYAAIYLGRCWLIVEERWPEYRKQQRDPFSVIGLKAGGKFTRGFVTFNVI